MPRNQTGRYRRYLQRRTKTSAARRKYLLSDRGRNEGTSKGYASRLRDKTINTVVERRMVEEIKKQEDETTTWLLSRVEHMKSGESLTNQQKSPNIGQMIKLSNNVDYWVDLTQLPAGNPNDPEGMDVGLYKIKQIQSRLRFYVNGLMPVHCVAQIVKINNSGRYGVGDDAGTNADIVPNTHMLPDTNLRYAGIHAKEKKEMTPPGNKNAVIVDRKRFILYPTTNAPYLVMTGNYITTTADNLGATSTGTTPQITNNPYSRQVYREKQIYLGKKYSRPRKLIQVLNQETQDNYLTDIRNKAKFIGDRFFLQIVCNYQQGFNNDTTPNDTSTSNVFFYGVSGCIYNFDKKPIQISVPLPENQTIDNETYDE